MSHLGFSEFRGRGNAEIEQRKDDKAVDSDAESDDAESDDEGEDAESDVEDEHEHLPESDLVFARSYVTVSKMYRDFGVARTLRFANAMPIRV